LTTGAARAHHATATTVVRVILDFRALRSSIAIGTGFFVISTKTFSVLANRSTDALIATPAAVEVIVRSVDAFISAKDGRT
jgi:hypothetical protein